MKASQSFETTGRRRPSKRRLSQKIWVFRNIYVKTNPRFCEIQHLGAVCCCPQKQATFTRVIKRRLLQNHKIYLGGNFNCRGRQNKVLQVLEIERVHSSKKVGVAMIQAMENSNIVDWRWLGDKSQYSFPVPSH